MQTTNPGFFGHLPRGASPATPAPPAARPAPVIRRGSGGSSVGPSVVIPLLSALMESFRASPIQTHPIPPMLEIKLAAVLGSSAAFAAALAAPASDFAGEVVVIALCLCGSIIGGFLGVAWKPGETLRQNYFLFGMNLAIGAIFAPFAVLLAAPHLEPEVRVGPIFCLAVGGVVSAFGVLVIRPLIPIFLAALEKRARRIAAKLADNEDPSPKK